jgi:hypothetical protein
MHTEQASIKKKCSLKFNLGRSIILVSIIAVHFYILGYSYYASPSIAIILCYAFTWAHSYSYEICLLHFKCTSVVHQIWCGPIFFIVYFLFKKKSLNRWNGGNEFSFPPFQRTFDALSLFLSLSLQPAIIHRGRPTPLPFSGDSSRFSACELFSQLWVLIIKVCYVKKTTNK